MALSSTDKDDKDEFIKHHVFLALSDISGIEIREIIKAQEDGNDQDLKFDLGLSIYHKKSLKTYFDNILSELESQKTVSIRECQELEKVSDCMQLINSKL